MEDSVDLVALLSTIWHRRRFILKSAVVGMLLGLAVALMTPNIFRATSTFVPQTSSEKAPGSLGGLAALAGINLNSTGGGTDIPPSLYPRLIESIPFKLEVLASPVIWQGDQITFKEYLLSKKEGMGLKIKNFTIGLPGQLIKILKGKKAPRTFEDVEYISSLSEEDYRLAKGLESIISLITNEKEGYVTISVVDEDPKIAAQMAKAAEELLQVRIIAFKTENTRNLYDFTQRQWESKQKELYALQDSLALFNDQNQQIFSSYYKNRQMRLDAEYNMLNAVYNELSSQKEQVALQLEKDTPIFSVIDPVRVPNEKSKPSRSSILFLGTFLGSLFSVCYVLIRKPIKVLMQNVKAPRA